MLISMLLCVTTILSVGFFIPIYETPIYFQTLTFFNFFRVQLESMILILFSGRCETTPILYNSYGINESQLSTNLYFLIIEAIILRFIGFIVYLFVSNLNIISTLTNIRKKDNQTLIINNANEQHINSHI